MEKYVSRKNQLAILATEFFAFIGILIETSMNVTFPTLITEFNVKISTIQWLTSGYLLIVTIVMSTTAYIIKRFNLQIIFRISISTMLIGTLLCAVSPNFWVLLIGRLAQGCATGLIIPLMFHLIMSNVPKNQRGVYVGFASMIISLAPALGPMYGGIMNQFLSWHILFWCIIPPIVLIATLGYFTINFKPNHKNISFDFGGFGIIIVIFTSLILAFNHGGIYGFTSSQFRRWMIVAIIAILIQFHHANSCKNPLLSWNILKQYILNLQLINFFFFQFINIGISFVIPIFAENVLGVKPFTAGMILFPGAIIGSCLSPLAGIIYDRKGLPIPLICANLFVLLSVILFTVYTNKLNAGLMSFFFILLRLGFNFGFGNLMSDASTHVNLENKADQSSLFSMMQQYAGAIGTSVMASMISSQENHHQNSIAVNMAGSHIDFMILILISLIASISGIAAIYFIKKNSISPK